MNKKTKKIILAAAAAAAGILYCCFGVVEKEDIQVMKSSDSAESDIFPEKESETEAGLNGIWVYVSGEVLYPGVYNLEEGSRMYEVIEMAGGLTDEDMDTGLNLAEVLQDGQHIRVRDISSEYIDGSDQNGPADDGLVNINTATLEELKTLPGIGEAKASAIIEYRQNSRFEKTEDIMNVSGIKESLFNRIRDLIRV